MEYSFMNGLISGYVGAICVYPIDVIKTRMQNINYKNGYHCFKEIISKEGYKSFYKGSFTQLIGIGPEKAVKFVVNDFISSQLYDSPLNKIIAGSCAGASQVIITNPIEIIKIQYQMNQNNKSLVQTIKSIGGIKNLYKGATVCLLRDIPFSAIYFPTYSYLKTKIDNYFLAASLAAVPAAYLVTPADVVKTRLQTKTNNYLSILDCINKIYFNEGIKGFFRGGLWRVLKSTPQFGITLYVYEKL
jgi:solute carrier family 25 aspartate/glutamate transporter 12/13